MSVARFNLYVQGWIVVFDFKEKTSHRLLEACSMLFFNIWLIAIVCTFPTWQEKLAWLYVSHAMAGLLHVQICISHFAESVYHGHAYNGEDDEWFKIQLATTMNVDCPWWMDWFHGGLQFQIEHHLFPRVPRHSYRKVRDLVKPFCAKWGVHYEERGFIGCNLKVLSALYRTAMAARNSKEADGGFYESQLWDGINARG